jgi:hypothetical protein
MFAAKSRWLSSFAAVAVLAIVPFLMAAGDRDARKNANDNANAESVEMFKAIEDGQIAVKFIPKDSSQAKVLIENKTKKPLSVKLPDAFAGVPVLAQNFGGGGGRSSSRDSNSSSQNQSMGGGMGGMGGMGGGGMGGGFMNVAPEKVAQLKVPTVCLEHGKAEPRAAIPYEIKPIDSFTQKAGVKELCQMLGSGKIDQRAAQAAAWNLSSGMSWEQLSAKHYRYSNGGESPYFSQAQIRAAMELAGNAQRQATENAKDTQPTSSPGAENYETPSRK